YTGFGAGDGRGRIMLFADTGAVSTSGEVFFPEDARPGMPQGSRTIDWLGGDFRYRSTVGLDDLVSSTQYPGISVGIGAEFTAVLDADGRVTGFAQVQGGSGYSSDLPPLIEIEGLATAVVGSYGPNGSIASLRVTYPGDGYGQPPRVTIKPNGFGRIVNSPNGIGSGLSTDGVTPMNRVHIRSLGGKLVAVAGAGVGDPLKPLKSDVETLVAQATTTGGVHVLEKDGLRIGKDQSVSGISTVNGDVSITTFGGALELGAPRQALDEEGRPLWQDAAKTIPIYDRDPVTGRIIYEGGDIAVGSADVKLTADDIEVNVDLNASGGSGTITLQPVNMKAEIGLAGTRARTEGLLTNGRLTGFDATKFWGGRGYTTAPLVIVDPAGQRAYASAVIEAGAVVGLEVIYGGTNYDPNDPPFVSIGGGGIAGALPANQANARAIVCDDGVITGFTITNAGSGYVTTPTISIASPGQALVQAVLDTANPDPVTGRFAVKEFVITNAGRNNQSAPFIEVAAPYDFTLDSDEVQKFAQSFAQVVIGRIEGQHLFHSPEAAFDGAVVLRAPRSGGTLDVASFNTNGPVSIVGSGNTFHFDSAAATVSGSSISIDDNVIVHEGVSGTATASTGSIVIFGTGKGMIDGDPTGTDVGDDEDLVLAAHTNVLVTGAIGSRWRLDDLTATSATRDTVVFEQSVGLTGDLSITGGAITIGGIVDVAGDLVIDASSMVAFNANVSVGGDLTITGATGVTFGGTLSVGGTITFVGVTGAVRFTELVTADDDVAVTATTLVEFLGGLAASGDVTITANEVELRGGIASVVGSATGTLVIQPHTVARPIRVGTPTGSVLNTLDVSDTDLAAIAPGWASVVIGDVAGGTGAVTIGSIGTQQGSKNSWIGNTTTIVGGSVTVAQKVDVAATAAYLQLVARTGGVTVNAAINETAAERNPWLRLEAAQAVAINAPIWSSQTVSLVSGTTITQSAYAPIHSKGMRVSASGGATAVSSGNSFDTLAVETSNAAISIREDSGYEIGTVDGVSGITVGTATATLESQGTVTQTQPINAGVLDLQGEAGNWVLNGANAVGTLTGNTGRIAYTESGAITLGAVMLSASSGTALSITAPGGITLGGDITTAGGDARFEHAVTLAADVAIDLSEAAAVGTARFLSTVDGTTSGQQGLAVTGNLVADGSIGVTTALEMISVSGTSTFMNPVRIRTTGNQTYSGEAVGNVVTVQAGVGSKVAFAGGARLLGLETATTDTAAYDVAITGAVNVFTNPVTFTNTGVVTLGDDAGDALTFFGGLTSTVPSLTRLAGTVATIASAADFGTVGLIGDTKVEATSAGNLTFGGTVNGGFALAVHTAGATTFSGAVGGTTPLARLTTDAGGTTAINGGSIATSTAAGQVFNDAVTLGNNTTLSAVAGAITFASTLDGAKTLAVNTQGLTTFGGAVGTTTPLVSLTTDAGGTTAISGGSIKTSGLAGQVFNDAVTLGNDATLTAGSLGAVTFTTTVDGFKRLVVNTAGDTTFGGAVGGTDPLAHVETDAPGRTLVNGGLIRTASPVSQLYADPVRLGADTLFDALNGAAITFSSTLDGGFNATVNTQGLTTFGGAVGGTTPLVSLTTDAGGTTAINGGSIKTSGSAGQVFNDAVTL
ncbi:MAG: beta strand repeat-containing protein, partial [Planctomycetota bacterium]